MYLVEFWTIGGERSKLGTCLLTLVIVLVHFLDQGGWVWSILVERPRVLGHRLFIGPFIGGSTSFVEYLLYHCHLF